MRYREKKPVKPQKTHNEDVTDAFTCVINPFYEFLHCFIKQIIISEPINQDEKKL